ncbi:MAG: OsmC family protein, partial [Bacteroidetes bacterium]|nr:OsmC family protein [Bacteroidota bacterium]
TENNHLLVATPPPFNGGMSGYWSPEHLYTAAVGSCLMTTFLAIAENSKLEFHSFTCKAEGKLEMVESKYLMTEVYLEPTIAIAQEKDIERAERIIQKSETACLISNSVKAKISMKALIEVR